MHTPLAPKLPNKLTVEFDSFRKLRFKERLQILLGYNIAVQTRVVVHRRDARVFGGTEVHLTKQVDASGQMKQQLTES